ncbi:MAG: rhombosortase [Planctomycetota bacterium]
MRRFVPWSTATLAAVTLLIAAIPGAASALELDRGEVIGGQLWRLLSGHFAHWSGEHLLWDVLALLMLGSMAERVSWARMWVTVLVSALAISGTFLLYRPELASYRGLSGIDSACVGFLLAHGWLQASRGDRGLRWLVVLGSVLFISKIGYECLYGGMLFVDGAATAMTVVPEAHGVGLLAGIAVRLWRRARKAASTQTCRERARTKGTGSSAHGRVVACGAGRWDESSLMQAVGAPEEVLVSSCASGNLFELGASCGSHLRREEPGVPCRSGHEGASWAAPQRGRGPRVPSSLFTRPRGEGSGGSTRGVAFATPDSTRLADGVHTIQPDPNACDQDPTAGDPLDCVTFSACP